MFRARFLGSSCRIHGVDGNNFRKQFMSGAMRVAPVSFCASKFEHCIAMLYNAFVIRNFLHKGLKVFFETGSKAGIQPAHAARLRLQLARLETATAAEDMDCRVGGFILSKAN
jgi:hypothetical protein